MLDIIQQKYLIISLILELLVGEVLLLLLIPRLEFAHQWDVEYFQMANMSIHVQLDWFSI